MVSCLLCYNIDVYYRGMSIISSLPNYNQMLNRIHNRIGGCYLMKIDRLFGVLNILLQNDRVTAPELAAKFEVNRRTIGRDIETLCQAGIPIVTHQGAGGGISIAKGFRLDKTVLTADELSDIIAAFKGIGTVSESSQIERTLEKLGASAEAVVSMSEPVVIDLASYHEKDLREKIEQIKCTIRESKLLEFDYYYEKGKSHRKIEPYFVIFQWASWHVFGFCLERQDWRLFKLMRLWNLNSCSENFNPREIPPERRDFNKCFRNEIRLVALFHTSEKYKLIENYGLHCYTETSDGLRLEADFTNRNFLINWLLGFGDNVKVLEPIDVATDIQKIAKNILKRYK